MMSYLVLFIGTPFIDGKFTNIGSAYGAMERHKERFPHLRIELVQGSGKFKVTDNLFWANHKEKITKADEVTRLESLIV